MTETNFGVRIFETVFSLSKQLCPFSTSLSDLTSACAPSLPGDAPASLKASATARWSVSAMPHTVTLDPPDLSCPRCLQPLQEQKQWASDGAEYRTIQANCTGTGKHYTLHPAGPGWVLLEVNGVSDHHGVSSLGTDNPVDVLRPATDPAARSSRK